MEKTIKQQRKNKLAYGKTRYAGSRLNIINDARAEDARLKRLENPAHKKRIDAVLEIADERVAVSGRYEYDFRYKISGSGDFSVHGATDVFFT